MATFDFDKMIGSSEGSPKKMKTMPKTSLKNNDEALYQQAVDFARDKYGDTRTSNADFINTVDSQFAKLGGSKTGREMRGDTVLDDAARGINDFTGAVNTTIGNGMDWIFDNTVGNLAAGAAGKDVGDAVKNWFTGEDLALIPDIASDVALYASGVGIPLAVAKGVARSAGDVKDAVTGKDSITLEDLDGDQRFARGAIGGLGVALSALPGIGKVANLAKGASKVSSSAARKEAETAAKKVTEEAEKLKGEYDDSIKNVQEKLREQTDASDKLDQANEAFSGVYKNSPEPRNVDLMNGVPQPAVASVAPPGISQSSYNKITDLWNNEVGPKVEAYMADNGSFPSWKQIQSDLNLPKLEKNELKFLQDAVKKVKSNYDDYNSPFLAAQKNVSEAKTAADNADEAFLQSTKDSTKAKEAYDKAVEAAKGPEERAAAAKKYDDMSGVGRFFSNIAGDVKGFGSAIRDIPKTISSSQDRIAAQKELARLLRQVNFGTKRGTDRETRDKILQDLMGGSDETENFNKLTELLKRAGIDSLDQIGSKASGAYKVKDLGNVPRFMPGVRRTFSDVLSDIGTRGNSSFAKIASDTAEEMRAKQFLGLVREAAAKDANGVARAATAVRNSWSNPGSAWQTVKANALGQGLSLPLIPLALQAQYGGDYIDNVQRLSKDVKANGAGKLLAATFPVGGGRTIAQRALPGIRGTANKFYPYGAIRARDTIDDFQDMFDDNIGRGKFEEALNNTKGGK